MTCAFWFLARCDCGWTERTQSKTVFDQRVKEHRASHK